MLAPQTRIVLFRSTQIFTGLLLIIAALGLSTNFDILRLGIVLGFLALTALSFLMGYRKLGVAGIAVVILFNPAFPFHFPRQIWVIIDILALAGLIYSTYWATNPYKKGSRFEQYISALFPEPDFIVVDRTRDNAKFLHRHVESDGHPDFVFRNQKTGQTFAVECKWRGRWAWQPNGGQGIWWSLHQFDRYEEYQKQSGTPVYVAFGIGGSPEKPAEVYFLELSRLRFPFLYRSLIKTGKSASQI